GTPYELYAISENQFHRFNGDNELLEKRVLDLSHGPKGIPAMSDNAFARMTTNQDDNYVLEFHLARNPAQIVKFVIDTLDLASGDVLEATFVSVRNVGAFSSDGTLFLLPVKVPNQYHTFFLFQLQFDVPHTEFVSIEKIKRIDVPDLPADVDNLNTIRFLDGNFYVTAQEGAWRISPSGSVKRLFQDWRRDFFSWEGKLYSTGLNDYDLYQSEDNGLTWTPFNEPSELQVVEPAGAYVFTYDIHGDRASILPDDLLNARSIVWPANAPPAQSYLYKGLAFYAGRYNFSIDREVYWTNEVVYQ
ncbi:MAG: hypothetical protein AAB316_08505, partial [Bacteroidota bacterium]